MQTHKQRHDEYIARLKAAGIATVSYLAPCCGVELETRAAESGEYWDTAVQCPDCDCLYWKITSPDGVKTSIEEQ